MWGEAIPSGVSHFSWPSFRCFYTLIGIYLGQIQLIGHDLARHTPVYTRSHIWQCISEQKKPNHDVEVTACRAQIQDTGLNPIKHLWSDLKTRQSLKGSAEKGLLENPEIQVCKACYIIPTLKAVITDKKKKVFTWSLWGVECRLMRAKMNLNDFSIRGLNAFWMHCIAHAIRNGQINLPILSTGSSGLYRCRYRVRVLLGCIGADTEYEFFWAVSVPIPSTSSSGLYRCRYRVRVLLGCIGADTEYEFFWAVSVPIPSTSSSGLYRCRYRVQVLLGCIGADTEYEFFWAVSVPIPSTSSSGLYRCRYRVRVLLGCIGADTEYEFFWAVSVPIPSTSSSGLYRCRCRVRVLLGCIGADTEYEFFWAVSVPMPILQIVWVHL